MDESSDCVVPGSLADRILRVWAFCHSEPVAFRGEESLLYPYILMAVGIPRFGMTLGYNCTLLNRSEFVMTETELRLMAAAAKMGFSVM